MRAQLDALATRIEELEAELAKRDAAARQTAERERRPQDA
jgi:BMFP domain-containing protein YqiC